MELITPGLGLLFWMTLAFLLLLFILGKFAWKPILKMLHERETSIHEALNAANQAKEEMKKLKFSNEQLMQEAKNERDAMMNEARKIKEKIIEEARLKAGEEASRIIESAKESIHNEKMAAMTELKNQIAQSSLDLARLILKRELSEPREQEAYIKGLLKDYKFN
ncbi:MAG: F0F1 ATP synthase subunit B [Bacteroidales bacterium]|nr:F0F1 ATP synthase subunit B [Bacteroidales bacterium]HNW72112.1 F0F1 ATP synthase subunit B [Bacteroidales bacterium]HPS49153.1 F0F1 ATP synthase subunit B [Bacteroidales bacterium]